MQSIGFSELSAPAQAFLTKQRLSGAGLIAFPSDASTRRYVRLQGLDLLLMEDPCDLTGFASFVHLSGHLLGLGLSAPRVFEADHSAGLALVEDFGDATYARRLAEGADEMALYRLAVDAILHLHHHCDTAQLDRSDYGFETYLDEIGLISEWYVPAVFPDIDQRAFAKEFRDLWRTALEPLKNRTEALLLRDFHIDNLMVLPDRSGVAQCGILDFQDGVKGPSEYDLLSLLQDARRDVSPRVESALLAHYCANAPQHLGSASDIEQRYALCAAQRHGRIMGLFVRLCQRDNKPGYLRHLPRVIGQFRAALEKAGLTRISNYLDTSLPGWEQKGAALTPEALIALK